MTRSANLNKSSFLKGLTTIFSLCFLCLLTISLQAEELSFLEGPGNTFYHTGKALNPSYPPENIFDSDIKTCWVCSGSDYSDTPSIMVKLPDTNTNIINIFPGYGKSQGLYQKNSRPSRIKIKLYAVFNPEGYVSENSALFASYPLNSEQIEKVPDTADYFSMVLLKSFDEIRIPFLDALEQYRKNYSIPAFDSGIAAEIQIIETIPGTEYSDVCISEISFSKAYVSPAEKEIKVKKIHSNPDSAYLEAVLSSGVKKHLEAEKGYTLQPISFSPDSSFAVFISMPLKIEGRAETVYHIADLRAGKFINRDIEAISDEYINGMPVLLETGKAGSPCLTFRTPDGVGKKILLY